MIDPFTEHLFDEGFEEYRDFMYSNYDMIMKHRTFFISDKYFSTSFKCERVKELLDFFELEEDFEKCTELKKLHAVVEVGHLFSEVTKQTKVRG
jgi:hypothetical protein